MAAFIKPIASADIPQLSQFIGQADNFQLLDQADVIISDNTDAEVNLRLNVGGAFDLIIPCTAGWDGPPSTLTQICVNSSRGSSFVLSPLYYRALHHLWHEIGGQRGEIFTHVYSCEESVLVRKRPAASFALDEGHHRGGESTTEHKILRSCDFSLCHLLFYGFHVSRLLVKRCESRSIASLSSHKTHRGSFIVSWR